MTSLQTIIKGCIAKDTKFQKLFYERYYSYAFKIIFRYSNHYDHLAYIVNNGFIKMFRNTTLFQKHAKDTTEQGLMTAIKKKMINIAINEMSDNNRDQEFSRIPDNIWQVSIDDQNADTLLLYKELIGHVKSLPLMPGIVFNMHVIDGFTHQEIADQLNISKEVSKLNLFKAQSALQRLTSQATTYSSV